MKSASFFRRLGFACAGLVTAWQRERSYRTQIVFALVASTVLSIIRPEPIWWAIVVIIIALVLAFELFNSAIEALADLLHPHSHPEIKAVKDMAAGAVLTISIAALLIGALLLLDSLSGVGKS